MRLRQPESQFKTPIKPQPNAKQQSCTYEVRTITPIFGGGVEAGVPDKDMPIRASAIRGQLRYWWRFLTSHRKDANVTSEKLFENERAIWGGMGEKNSDHSSKIFIRIHGVKCKPPKQYEESQAEYALFPAKSETRTNKPAKHLFEENIVFKLVITAPESIWPELEEAVRWWMTFGGIGSRTHRGVGSVDVKKIDENIKEQILPIEKDEAAYFNCKLVFSPTHKPTPIAAWEDAVDKLKNFRQTAKPNGIGRNRNNGRSCWPEADSIREILNSYSLAHSPIHPARISFPRAYFGLPIVFKFIDQDDPVETQLFPEGYERLASPLILKPYRLQNGKYVASALVLPINHIENIKLRLVKNGKNIPVQPNSLSEIKKTEWNNMNWSNWPSNWWCSSLTESIEPIKNNCKPGQDCNPLDAFLSYFVK